MIYITGDCHANYTRFSTKSFPEQKDMTRDDFVIVCGDFGLWHDDKSEKYRLDWLADKNFTLLWVDGNHENFDRLYSDEFEIVDFHGGKAHKIRENVYHLMRGHVFELQGHKFFAFGGASSHDISDGIIDRDNYETEDDFQFAVYRSNKLGLMTRVNHYSWWKEELPSQQEMDFGIETLKKHGNEVDFVITHCLPQSVASFMSHGSYKPDIITNYFETLIQDGLKINKGWYSGHYHIDEVMLGKFHTLYYTIERVL